MSALFISTYELGHQPQLAAELAAELGDGSLQVLDMSKVPFSQALDVLNHADQVILTAPMLTGGRWLALGGLALQLVVIGLIALTGTDAGGWYHEFGQQLRRSHRAGRPPGTGR